MVQEMKKGFQSAVEELGKIQAKEEHDSARGKQQQQLENLTETLQEIKVRHTHNSSIEFFKYQQLNFFLKLT